MDKKIEMSPFNQDDLLSVLNICRNSIINAHNQHVLLNEELRNVGELAELTSIYLKLKIEKDKQNMEI